MIFDTCAIVWMATDRERISNGIHERIRSEENIGICTLSFWEIGIKIARKKLVFPMSVNELISLYAGIGHVHMYPVDNDLIVRSLDLPWDHADPVDRFIVALAQRLDDDIISSDRRIAGYYLRTYL